MLKHLLHRNPKESCGEKGKRLGVVVKARDEMDSDPRRICAAPHQMLYCLQIFVSCRLRERSREGGEKTCCVIYRRDPATARVLFRKADLQPVAFGWKSEGGACGGGREGGLGQKTFLIAFGLERIS